MDEILKGQTNIYDYAELFGLEKPKRKRTKKDFMNPPVAVPTEEFIKEREIKQRKE